MPPSHIAIALGTALLWGFGFVTSKYGADHMPPLFFLALRFTLMALMLLWFVRPPAGRWLAVSLFALTMGAGHFGLFYVALNIGVEASTAAIIWLTQVPLSALLAGIFLRERPGWMALLGIAIAFGGAVLLVGEPRHTGNALGIALMFGSSIAWAIANVQVKRLTDISPLALNGWMSAISALLLFPLSFALEEGQIASLLQPDWRLHGSLVYQVVGSTLLAYWAWYYLLAHNKVATVAGFMLLVPVVGVIFGVFLLGDPITWQTLVGGAIIVSGVALIVLKRAPEPAVTSR
ncbi:MAG: EamA family transporter [Rhodospirillales bacterium]|nr:EamA family transporter [Rhodospirillales bacterium]